MQLHIHPNPTRSSFQVSVETLAKDPVWLQITDIQGRILMQRNYMPGQVLLIGEEWGSGVYLFKVKQGKMVKVWKAVKQ